MAFLLKIAVKLQDFNLLGGGDAIPKIAHTQRAHT